MNDEALTVDELMDVLAVLTHLRSIFPVVHQDEHWTVPITAKLEQQLARRRAAGETTMKERGQKRGQKRVGKRSRPKRG